MGSFISGCETISNSFTEYKPRRGYVQIIVTYKFLYTNIPILKTFLIFIFTQFPDFTNFTCRQLMSFPEKWQAQLSLNINQEEVMYLSENMVT